LTDIEKINSLISKANEFSLEKKVEFINEVRNMVSEISPFKTEPIDSIQWVKADDVAANDYNPNSVAPPEMELLRHSINHDGYTQPVVTWKTDKGIEVIDGFHRTRVCKEFKDVRERVHGYLPVVFIKDDNSNRSDRMASTIRHNRARGKHNVTAMSDIVVELKNRNWKDSRIARELGMDEDEVLRLCQITGLESLFEDKDFSKSWEAGDSVEDDYEVLTDDFEGDEDRGRTANTSDPTRIFHTFDKWECVEYNFYGTKVEGMTKEQCEIKYKEFLLDLDKFEYALKQVISQWKHSCEHYLTNKAMNRIAWLGQASVAFTYKIPSKYCGGFNLLTKKQQDEANEMALKYLNLWLKNNGIDEVDMDDALSIGRQIAIY